MHAKVNKTMLRFYEISKQQIILILRYIYSLWKLSFKLYYQILRRSYPTLIPYENKKERLQRRRHSYKLYILIIFIIIVSVFSIVNLVEFIALQPTSEIAETNVIYQSTTEKILLNAYDYSIHYIYIDIGCFNGETIEYFIHFTPNSTLYDIIVFEPDPYNYQLCKQRLAQTKYENFNITIIPKVAWIRDEKVSYLAKHGRGSRININQTNDHSSMELDAIDFSSWLARLFKPKNTKLHVKISAPGAEVEILEKMILDRTLGFVEKYDIEWSDRASPYNRSPRIYAQLMLDSFGFDCLYLTRLQDVKEVFQMNESFTKVTKYYGWLSTNELDTFAHYLQRPDVELLILNKTKINKY